MHAPSIFILVLSAATGARAVTLPTTRAPKIEAEAGLAVDEGPPAHSATLTTAPNTTALSPHVATSSQGQVNVTVPRLSRRAIDFVPLFVISAMWGIFDKFLGYFQKIANGGDQKGSTFLLTAGIDPERVGEKDAGRRMSMYGDFLDMYETF